MLGDFRIHEDSTTLLPTEDERIYNDVAGTGFASLPVVKLTKCLPVLNLGSLVRALSEQHCKSHKASKVFDQLE